MITTAIELATALLIIGGYLAITLPIAILLGYLCGTNDRVMGIDQEGRRWR